MPNDACATSRSCRVAPKSVNSVIAAREYLVSASVSNCGEAKGFSSFLTDASFLTDDDERAEEVALGIDGG